MRGVLLALRAVLLIGSAASFIWVWQLQIQVTAVPKETQFHGSIDVLLLGSKTGLPAVRSMLTVSHGLSTSGADRIQIEYVACGEKSAQSIDGVVVFAGGARLRDPVELSPLGLEPISMKPEASMSMGGAAAVPEGVQLEVYSFHLDLPSCAPAQSGQSAVTLGSGLVLGGDTQSPVETESGDRYWFAPPVVGGLPSVSSSGLGVFTFPSVGGNYYRNIDRTNQVRLELAAKFTPELEQPQPLSAGPSSQALSWDGGSTSLAPDARLLDQDQQSIAQYQLVIASIVFGIGGSIIASALWRLLFGDGPKPKAAQTDGPAHRDPAPEPAQAGEPAHQDPIFADTPYGRAVLLGEAGPTRDGSRQRMGHSEWVPASSRRTQ